MKTKHYNVIIKEKSGSEVLYAGVISTSKKEAKNKVKQDRIKRNLDKEIKSISVEFMKDWNKGDEDLYSFWLVNDLN